MLCRVCGTDIDRSTYCYKCGWLNGEVELLTYTIKVNRTNISSGLLIMENNRNADVKVKACMDINTNTISFDPQFYAQGMSKELIIKGNSKEELKIYINLKNYKQKSQFQFNVTFESNDNSPKLMKEEFFKRPFILEQKRKWICNVSVEILEPSKLEFDKEIIVFSDDMKIRTINIINQGYHEIILSKYNIDIDDNFYLHMKENEIDIQSGETYELKIEILNPIKNYKTMMISYESALENITQNIMLYNRLSIDDTPSVLCDNVIAVDFGTTKTASAYMDISRLENNSKLNDKVKMIPLDEQGDSKRYDIPSCMVFKGRDVYIGRRADGMKDTEEFISSMKMSLHDDTIVTKKNGRIKDRRDTREVITSFLKAIRERIDGTINDSNNTFVFTLPVLDNDIDGVLFEKQKEVTLSCAEAAGFKGNIRTISEPEAAMFYILNDIKDNPDNWNNVNLQIGDQVCVFDYGGGTLDICIGTYALKAGCPVVEDTVSIGTYRDGSKKDSPLINLGGNRLDDQMAVKIYDRYSAELELTDIESDENGNLNYDNAVFGGSDDKNYLVGVEWPEYKIRTRHLKEELSTKWDDIPDGLDIDPKHTNSNFIFSKDMFESVVYTDLDYAIDGMKSIIKDRNMAGKSKYIFMVGGSSLIKIIKRKLKREFSDWEVFDAYDFSRARNRLEAYEDIRQSAIYPVVRGAAISYMMRITNLIPFDITIIPKKYKDRHDYAIQYKKNESFRTKSSRLKGNIALGEWIIIAGLEKGQDLILASFKIENGKDDIPFSVEITAKIESNRQIKIYYKFPDSNNKIEVRDLGGYI